MASLFGSPTVSSVANPPTPPASTLRIQTAVEGLPIPLLYGQVRIAGNLIWYGDFYSVNVPASNAQPANSGKGGLFGGSNAGGAASPTSTYNYFASVEIAIASGPLGQFGPNAWASKVLTTVAALNLGGFIGDFTQAPWSYLTATHPNQALGYRGIGYLAGQVALGSSAELPNWTFEVVGGINGSASGLSGTYDVPPDDMLRDMLTNTDHGVPGWFSQYNGDWTQARIYMIASNLLVSYALAQQTAFNSFANEFCTSLNLMPVWSDAVLKLIPLGDEQVTGNGVAYFPNVTPIYDLTDADYLPNQASFGGSNSDPVSAQQTPARDQNNVVKVQYIDRANSYNLATLAAMDDAAVRAFGERGSAGVQAWHWFCTQASASQAASLALGRNQIANKYAVTVRPRFILLDPGDIITLTDSVLNLFRAPVRITNIKENADRSLSIQADEFLQGSGAAPLYGTQSTAGFKPNYAIDPGGINTPIIFEPSDELAMGLSVWAAVSGVNSLLYGGCDAYVSYDNGATYSFLQRTYGSSRMGFLTAVLPAVPVNVAGQAIDTTNTLSVDLTESNGQLISVSSNDALVLNSACWLENEIIAYQTSTLVSPHHYNLSFLVRGGNGTQSLIVAHPIGSRFVRLDKTLFTVPYDPVHIGTTISLKFLPFNIYGLTPHTLADVSAYTYTLTGAALASPLPNVANVRQSFTDGFQELTWDEIKDFRSGIRYKIRRGDSWATAQEVGDIAHPPFKLLGFGTYWFAAYCQPTAGLTVYSNIPTSYAVTGNMLTTNVVLTSDQQALGWPGIMTNMGVVGTGVGAFIRLIGSNDILTTANVLTIPDILNFGGVVSSGNYEIRPVDYPNAGHVTDCFVNCSWKTSGTPLGQNILTVTDFLNLPDVLGSAATQFVDGWVEIATSQGASDAFQSNDLFAEADAFNPALTFTAYQRYVPGVYSCQVIKLRVVLSSQINTIIANNLVFNYTVSVKARIDHYQTMSVGSGGVTVIFVPDATIFAAPFNGGIQAGGVNGPLPYYTIGWPNQGGDKLVIDSISLAQMAFHFENPPGTPVARTGVSLTVEGF